MENCDPCYEDQNEDLELQDMGYPTFDPSLSVLWSPGGTDLAQDPTGVPAFYQPEVYTPEPGLGYPTATPETVDEPAEVAVPMYVAHDELGNLLTDENGNVMLFDEQGNQLTDVYGDTILVDQYGQPVNSLTIPAPEPVAPQPVEPAMPTEAEITGVEGEDYMQLPNGARLPLTGDPDHDTQVLEVHKMVWDTHNRMVERAINSM